MLGDHAVRHQLAFSSCRLCSPRKCQWYLGRSYEPLSLRGPRRSWARRDKRFTCPGGPKRFTVFQPWESRHGTAEPRSHRDVLALAGENDNDCLLTGRAVYKVASHRTGGDHSNGKFEVISSVTDGGSRQWKQTEQLKTIVAPIGVRLILGKLVLHSYSPMQNQMVRENGRGFRSEDRRENCCMTRKAAAPEIAAWIILRSKI